MTIPSISEPRPVLKLNQGDPSEARIYYCVHFVAEALGFFAEEGVTVAFQTAREGGHTVRGGQVPAVVAGHADLTVGGPMVAMKMLEDGEDRLVSFCAVANGNPWVLASAAPADGLTLAGLKGRSVVDVANIGTASMAFRWVAAKAGVSESEFDLRPGSGDEAADLEAVRRGEVDYALHSLHALAPTLAAGRLYLALDLAERTGTVPWSAYLARPERIAAHRTAFAGFVRAIGRAQHWMTTRPSSEIAALIAHAYPNYPLDALAFGLERYIASGLLPATPEIRREDFARFSQILQDIGWLREPASFERLVDNSLAESASPQRAEESVQ